MLVGIIALFWLHQKATGDPDLRLRGRWSTSRRRRRPSAGCSRPSSPPSPSRPRCGRSTPGCPTPTPRPRPPTTVLLAGVMSKLGVYGFLRYRPAAVPRRRLAGPSRCCSSWPWSGSSTAPWSPPCSATSRLLVAYSSVVPPGLHRAGHLRLHLPGLQGGVFYMVAHGLVIGGLFFITGMLEERRGTRRDRGVRRPPSRRCPAWPRSCW